MHGDLFNCPRWSGPETVSFQWALSKCAAVCAAGRCLLSFFGGLSVCLYVVHHYILYNVNAFKMDECVGDMALFSFQVSFHFMGFLLETPEYMHVQYIDT